MLTNFSRRQTFNQRSMNLLIKRYMIPIVKGRSFASFLSFLTSLTQTPQRERDTLTLLPRSPRRTVVIPSITSGFSLVTN